MAQADTGTEGGRGADFDPNEKPERPGISTDPGTSITCLPNPLKQILGKIADRYGAVKVTSTWRPAARAARLLPQGLRAMDFRVPGVRPRVVLEWVRALPEVGGNHVYWNGLIHIDTGPRRPRSDPGPNAGSAVSKRFGRVPARRRSAPASSPRRAGARRGAQRETVMGVAECEPQAGMPGSLADDGQHVGQAGPCATPWFGIEAAPERRRIERATRSARSSCHVSEGSSRPASSIPVVRRMPRPCASARSRPAHRTKDDARRLHPPPRNACGSRA